MNVRARLAVAVTASVAFGVTSASATRIPFSSARVAAGAGTSAPCDADGVAVAYTNGFDTTVADYRTTAATVSGIAPGCAGRTVSVTIRSSTGAALWQGSATVSGTTAVLSVPSVTSSAIGGWAVSLTS